MGLIPASFFQKRVPDKYKQYVTDARSLRAWDEANASGDMSAWEGDVGYQAQAATANPAGENPPPATATVLPETANTTEGGGAQDNLLSAALALDPPGVVAQKTGEITEIPQEEDDRPEDVTKLLSDTSIQKVDDTMTNPPGQVTTIQEGVKKETGIEARTPGVINKLGSMTIEGLSRVGENWDEVQTKIGGYKDSWNEFKGEAGAALRGKIAPGGKPYAVGQDVEGTVGQDLTQTSLDALDYAKENGITIEQAKDDIMKMEQLHGTNFNDGAVGQDVEGAGAKEALAEADLQKRRIDMVKAGGKLGDLRTPTARAVNFGSGDRMNQYKVGR